MKKRKSATPSSGSFEVNDHSTTRDRPPEVKKRKRAIPDINWGVIFFLIIMVIAPIIYIIVMLLHDFDVSPAKIALSIILPIVVVAIGIAIMLLRYSKRKYKRQQQLAEWAQSRGLRFIPEEDPGIGSRFWSFDCLQWGDNRYGYNVMNGTFANRTICAFDYHFEMGANLSQHQGVEEIINTSNEHLIASRHNFSAVIVDTGLRLKPLFIRPERFVDKIADAGGYYDIKFESTDFNNQFHVKSSDRSWAYDVLTQATMDLLLQSCHFNIEFNGSQVIAYRNTTFTAGYFEEALQLLTGILDRLPESLVR